MSKHSYNATCACTRCAREHGRRNAQARADHARKVWPAIRLRHHGRAERAKPAAGTQAWAEARGGLIGGYETD